MLVQQKHACEKVTKMALLDQDLLNTRRWIHAVITLPNRKVLAERVIIAEDSKIPWNISVGIQTMYRNKNTFEDDIKTLSGITKRRFGLSLEDMKDKIDIYHVATHKPQSIGFLYQCNVTMDIYKIKMLSSITFKISNTCEIRALDFDYMVDSAGELNCDPRSREAIDLLVGLNINL